MAELEPQIAYEDRDLLLCIKPAGILSEAAGGKGMPDLLSAAYRSSGKPDYIAGVHRLDKNVGGLMLFSRRPEITGKLTALVAQHQICKQYVAVLRGRPLAPEGILEDLLFRDASHNKTYVVRRMRKGVREAKLSYRVLEQVQQGTQPLTLVLVQLFTGRTHQIRVQFASRQLPLLGDIRYGSKDPNCDAALWSSHLSFRHPKTGAPVFVTQGPPEQQYPWNLFSAQSYASLPLPCPDALPPYGN